MIKVSVLIPIYNAAQFLEQSLKSAADQTLTDVEFICLNDGSTDASLSIAQSFARQDPRFIIVDKPNTGYGDTMNQGIKQARGEYIAILEPDDYLDPDALTNLYQLASENKADIVKSNFYHESGQNSHSTHHIRPRDAGRVYDHKYTRLFTFPPAIWSSLYRRQFLLDQQIEFLPTPGASYQDLGFNFKTLAVAERIVLTPKAFLHYRLDNSDSSSNNPGKVNCVVKEYASIADFLKQHNLYSELGCIMNAAKFRNYYWNWQRLQGAAAQEFFQTMRAELSLAQQEHLLCRRYFSILHWCALWLILKYPRLAQQLFHRA